MGIAAIDELPLLGAADVQSQLLMQQGKPVAVVVAVVGKAGLQDVCNVFRIDVVHKKLLLLKKAGASRREAPAGTGSGATGQGWGAGYG